MNDASDHLDRLLDTLLKEELGGESPPDLAQKILARAARRKVSFARIALAAAAAVALVLAGWLMLTGRYPAPTATGGCAVEDGGAVRRSAVIRTAAETAVLKLGGYCRVEMRPASALQIEGAEWAEQIRLVQGEVLCEVEHDKGTFVVRTEIGSVQVTGTRFVVGIREEKGEGPTISRRMFVRVLAGAVLASGMWGSLALQAGDEGTLPPKPAPPTSGTLVGILTAKTDSTITVKVDGAAEPQKFVASWIAATPEQAGHYDNETLAAIKALRTPNLVELKWTQDEHLRVTSVKTIAPAVGATGSVTGTVTWKGEAAIDVKPDGTSPTERYIVQWANGSVDKRLVAAIRRTNVGDKVTVNWKYDERKRIVAVEVVAPAAPAPVK